MGKGSKARPVSKDYGKHYKPFKEFKLNIMSDEDRKRLSDTHGLTRTDTDGHVKIATRKAQGGE